MLLACKFVPMQTNNLALEKETAIDFMISKKLVSKIEGRFEEYVKTALKQLLDLIAKTYGEKVLPKTEKVINNILRTL